MRPEGFCERRGGVALSEIISLRLRSLLEHHLSHASTLREIRGYFDDAGIANVPAPAFTGGQRRTLVAGYYASLDFTDPADARKFLDVPILVLKEQDRLYEINEAIRRPPWSKHLPASEHPMARIFRELGRSGYEWQDGAIMAFLTSERLADTKSIAAVYDLGHRSEHVQRIEKSLDTDPRQAIGSAKEMVETVAKTILDKRGAAYERGDDILVLSKAIFQTLKQVADNVPDANKGAAIIKRTLNNLATLVQGIAELRSFYGTGHGQGGRVKGLGVRHAKLAVGSAATLVTYWLETDRETP